MKNKKHTLLPGAFPTDPDERNSRIRFLCHHQLSPLANHTGDTPCGASLCWPWPC